MVFTEFAYYVFISVWPSVLLVKCRIFSNTCIGYCQCFTWCTAHIVESIGCFRRWQMFYSLQLCQTELVTVWIIISEPMWDDGFVAPKRLRRQRAFRQHAAFHFRTCVQVHVWVHLFLPCSYWCCQTAGPYCRLLGHIHTDRLRLQILFCVTMLQLLPVIGIYFWKLLLELSQL